MVTGRGRFTLLTGKEEDSDKAVSKVRKNYGEKNYARCDPLFR